MNQFGAKGARFPVESFYLSSPREVSVSQWFSAPSSSAAQATEDLGTCMSRSLSHLLVSTMNLSTVARDCPATGVASSSCHRGRDHQGELGGDGSGRCVCMEVCTRVSQCAVLPRPVDDYYAPLSHK